MFAHGPKLLLSHVWERTRRKVLLPSNSCTLSAALVLSSALPTHPYPNVYVADRNYDFYITRPYGVQSEHFPRSFFVVKHSLAVCICSLDVKHHKVNNVSSNGTKSAKMTSIFYTYYKHFDTEFFKFKSNRITFSIIAKKVIIF